MEINRKKFISDFLSDRMILSNLKRLSVDSTGRLRVGDAILTSGILTTVSTVTTVTNITNWGLSSALAKSQWESNLAFQQGFRRNLVVV